MFCFEVDKDRLKTSGVVLFACGTIWLGLVHSSQVEWEEPSVLGFYLGLPLEVCEDFDRFRAVFAQILFQEEVGIALDPGKPRKAVLNRRECWTLANRVTTVHRLRVLFRTVSLSWVWWPTPLILSLKRHRQAVL